MTLDWLLSWWNLIFVVPFSIALLYLGLYTATGITFGEADADADMDADADADADVHADVDTGIDADADMDADADADVHADVDADADADADTDTEAETVAAPGVSLHMAALSWLGVGRVPVSIVLMVLLICWGVIGFLANVLAWPRLGANAYLISLPAAIVISIIATRLCVSAVGRWLPTYETYAHRRHELLGCEGEVILPVDENSGMVSVRDEQGDLFQIHGRTRPGAGALPKGMRVCLTAYNGKSGLYYVVPSEKETQKGGRV
jgi:membrane protein implicated in regulation of membrane protease activity